MRLLQLTWLLPIVLAYAGYVSTEEKIEPVYEWKYVDYVWESDDQKQAAIDSGKYDHEKIIMLDIQPLKDGRILVTCPKDFDNPASLATISDQTGDGGPLLAPYPDWSSHTAEDCSGITSVNKVVLDDEGYLWLVDSGKIGKEQVCPAVIYKMDPETDEVLLQKEIPDDLISNPSENGGRIVVLEVENTDDGFLVLIGDDATFGLILFDGENIWRRDDKTFEPTAPDFSVDGYKFSLNRGLHDMVTLTGRFFEGSWVMFRPLASLHTFIARKSELFDESVTEPEYYMTNWTLQSQETTKAIAKNSNIIFSPFSEQMKLGCWHAEKPITASNIAVLNVDSTYLQYVSIIKITYDEDGEETIWVFSDKAHRYKTGTMDFDEINFRALKATVSSATAGTVCEAPSEVTETTMEEMNMIKYDESA